MHFTMKYYFLLQYTRLTRWLQYIGVHPIVGLIVSVVGFVALSIGLFYKTEFAGWIYLSIAISLLLKLSHKQRNDFLNNVFISSEYKVIRLVENGMLSLPFLFFLVFQGEWTIVLVLILSTILLSFYTVNRLFNGTIPTPFKKLSFEFIVGFRKTFWMIGIAYFLIIKGLQVDNYYLGLFGLALVFLTSLSYYQKPEDPFFVRIHSLSPKEFLWNKYLAAIGCTSILSIVGMVMLLVGFSADWVTTLMIYLIGSLLLGAMILTKYSGYPREIGIPQGFLFSLSVIFPPMLLITIWLFYSQSTKRLNTYLEC